jgi:hypothetical protein
MIESDIIYAAIDNPIIMLMKINAIDGSILYKKMFYYNTDAFLSWGSIKFFGYAPNTQVLVTYIVD